VVTPLFRKFVLITGTSISFATLSNVDGLIIGMTAYGTGIAGPLITAINTTTNQVTFSATVTVTYGQLITFYSSTLEVLALDYLTLQGMTLTITPYVLTTVPQVVVWYTGLSFVNIPTDNTCVYEFNFIICAPNNTKTLSFSSGTISINGTSYPVNGYNNLSIGPTNITYILQTIKILSGTTSANQTYTIITTIQGI
jgi:hypothetical protein